MDGLDYDQLIQEALRDVVKKTLQNVSKKGLPGNHHFYITFRTDRQDVSMPQHLREQHPDEVTVVMQHQFWDLNIGNDDFSVTLSFNGHHERLTIPYNALISFMDPSVKFGLQFTPDETLSQTSTLPAATAETNVVPAEKSGGKENSMAGKDNVVTLSSFRNRKK